MRRALLLLAVLLLGALPVAGAQDGGGRLRGVVTGPDGAPVADASVNAFGLQGASLRETRTDASGAFDLALPAPDCYALHVAPPEESSLRAWGGHPADGCEDLAAGATVWSNVTLAWQPVVRGFVVDAAGAPAILRNVWIGSSFGATDDQGAFLVRPEPGPQRVSVMSAHSADNPSRAPCPGGDAPDCIDVPEKGTVWRNLTVPVTPDVTIRVRADMTGEPIRVLLVPVERPDEASTWHLQAVGLLRPLLEPGAYDGMLINVGTGRSSPLPAIPEQPCLVVAKDGPTVLDITVGNVRLLRGVVRDAEGRPIGGVGVAVDDWERHGTTTGADGAYEFLLPQGPHRLFVGWQPIRWDKPYTFGDGYSSSYLRHECEIGPLCVPFDLQDDLVLDVQAPPVARVVVETRHTLTGEPFAGAWVRVWNAEFMLGGDTDEAGRFEGPLPLGNYSFTSEASLTFERQGAQGGCVACIAVGPDGATIHARIAPGKMINAGNNEWPPDPTGRGVAAFVPEDPAAPIAMGVGFPMYYLNAPLGRGGLASFSGPRNGTIMGAWAAVDVTPEFKDPRPATLQPMPLAAAPAEAPGAQAFLVRGPDEAVLLVARATGDTRLSNATVLVDGRPASVGIEHGYVLARAPDGLAAKPGRAWHVVVRNATGEATMDLVETAAPEKETRAVPVPSWAALAAGLGVARTLGLRKGPSVRDSKEGLMGTRSHAPDTGKPATFGQTGHSHDADTRALGPGVRPGTRSRILEARERAAKRP